MKRIIHPKTPVLQTKVDDFHSNKFVLENFLFDKQLDFINDPAPFKVAVCSRRSGKTVACAADLVHTAMNNPDVVCLYITLTGTSGKRIIWKEFKSILKKFNIKAKENEIELSITFPHNGSVIYVAGAKDASEIEKFRGLAMKKVYIDECQSFRGFIKDLIDDIIGPALMDYAGSLCLIGTPGPIPAGYFYDCYNSKAVESDDPDELAADWSKHHWTFWDNPHIPIKSKRTHDQVFKREMRRRGISDYSNPSVQREWFGQWRFDSESLVVQYRPEMNHFDTLPTASWHYILGVDVGYKDADALAVLAWSEASPVTYLVDELIVSKQGITELAEQIQAFQKRYDIYKIVMDMGGLGLKIGEELSRRYMLPVEAADKTRKMENFSLMNDSLRTGRLKAKSTSQFAKDSYLVEYDWDKSKPDRLVVSDRYHSDIIDAVLYAFKCSPAYSYQEPSKEPAHGSKEWADAQPNSMFLAELEGHIRDQDDYNISIGHIPEEDTRSPQQILSDLMSRYSR